MKKYILTILCALTATAMSAQDVMVVEKTDNTTTKFNLSDIRRIYFETSGSTEIPPTSNSQLACRLKDKDGNPVLLTGIRSVNNPDRWDCKFNYDQSGNLISVVEDNATFNIDGLNVTGEETHTEEIEKYEIQLKLNEAGLISNATVTIKEYYRASGVLNSIESATCSYNYDKDGQMTDSKYEAYGEDYNADGKTVKERTEKTSATTYTWSGGNLTKRTRVKRENEHGTWEEETKTDDYNYGSGVNTTRQQVDDFSDNDWPFIEKLVHLGLFGVGSKNFEVGSSFSLNTNGTIDTEDDHKYIYQ